MLDELPGLNARWRDVVGEPLQLGIGLNTGPAQVGNTGSPRKFKYGPLGHTVNLASRVQDATKKLGIPLLITGPTRDQLPPTMTTCPVEPVCLAGVKDPVILHALQGVTPAGAP
jgi:adenylate cyclase